MLQKTRKRPFKRRQSQQVVNEGDYFNNLTFLAEAGWKGKYRIGLWQCDCGKKKHIRISSVIAGDTKSCGCQKYMALANDNYKILLDIGCDYPGCVNVKYKDYKISASNRKLKFSLSIIEFYNLIIKKCHYCEEEPFQIIKRYTSAFRYNGIDRIENNVGYVKSNCVPCCGICNIMKQGMSQEEFIKKCFVISQIHIIKTEDR